MLSTAPATSKRRRSLILNQPQPPPSLLTGQEGEFAGSSGFSSDDEASSNHQHSTTTAIPIPRRKRQNTLTSPAKTNCSTSCGTTVASMDYYYNNDDDEGDDDVYRSSSKIEEEKDADDDGKGRSRQNSRLLEYESDGSDGETMKSQTLTVFTLTQQTISSEPVGAQNETPGDASTAILFSPSAALYTPLPDDSSSSRKSVVVENHCSGVGGGDSFHCTLSVPSLASPGLHLETPCRLRYSPAVTNDIINTAASTFMHDIPLSLTDLPAEIIVHCILPLLSLKDIFALTRCSQTMYSLCRAAMSYSHPLAIFLCLPRPFYILSFGEWKRNVFQQSSVRREWLRTLSKRKRFILPEWFEEFKLVLSCVIGQAIAHSTETDLSNLASMLYRSFSIILGLHDRRRECNCSVNGWHLTSGPEFFCESFPQITGGSHENNLKWFLLTIGAEDQLIRTNQQLLPCIIRSLLWIQKEKHNKRRLLSQVEQMFMALPPLLACLPPDQIRRFIKGLSDEARSMREKITIAAETPIDGDDGDAVNNNPQRTTSTEADDAQQQQQQAPNSRRFFEPIKLAVMVCTATATLYPHCFNAQTLATILRNTFNLLAWGVPHAEIKYQIFMLCLAILRDIDASIADPSPAQERRSANATSVAGNSGGGETGRVKLIALVDILQSWIPQMNWELARDALIDIRDLFQVHLLKLSRHSPAFCTT